MRARRGRDIGSDIVRQDSAGESRDIWHSGNGNRVMAYGSNDIARAWASMVALWPVGVRHGAASCLTSLPGTPSCGVAEGMIAITTVRKTVEMIVRLTAGMKKPRLREEKGLLTTVSAGGSDHFSARLSTCGSSRL
ncbi:MAG: hypothetical protein CL810_15120 [Cobetia sp.]|nr:hypothetical protein [Cobetia sp.]HBJ29223.1 hypothetical protein [Cobetia sp.]